MNRIRYAAVLCAIAATIGLRVGIAGARPAAEQTYSRDGFYQTMGQLTRDWKSPYPLVNGVPMVDYGTFTARNPVTAAQYGLANYSLWLHFHDRYRWAAAKRVADWLVRTQHKDGKWEYSFPEPAPRLERDARARMGIGPGAGTGAEPARARIPTHRRRAVSQDNPLRPRSA